MADMQYVLMDSILHMHVSTPLSGAERDVGVFSRELAPDIPTWKALPQDSSSWFTASRQALRSRKVRRIHAAFGHPPTLSSPRVPKPPSYLKLSKRPANNTQNVHLKDV